MNQDQYILAAAADVDENFQEARRALALVTNDSTLPRRWVGFAGFNRRAAPAHSILVET
jgi:hypothetical protein